VGDDFPLGPDPSEFTVSPKDPTFKLPVSCLVKGFLEHLVHHLPIIGMAMVIEKEFVAPSVQSILVTENLVVKRGARSLPRF
jgi:hypothetical protein